MDERQQRLRAEAVALGVDWWPADEDLRILDAIAGHEPTAAAPGLTTEQAERAATEGFVAVYSRLIGLESYGLLAKEVIEVARPDIAQGVSKGVVYWQLTSLAQGLLVALPQTAAPGTRQRLSPLAD